MKLRLYIFSFCFLLLPFILSSQRRASNYMFAPGWYAGVYAGPNLVVSEGYPYSSLTDAVGVQISPALGYQFSPFISLRAGLDIAQHIWPNETTLPDSIYKAGIQSLYLDAVLNLSNAFAGYNLNRAMDISLFAGVGGLHRNTGSYATTFLGMMGRVGGQIDIQLTQFLNLNLRAELNICNDNYNNFVTGVPIEIIPATLLGISYRFKTRSSHSRGCCN